MTLIAKLRSRKVSKLPSDWKKGRLCPHCYAEADRPKCLWDMGGSCPRHDPEAYDDSPFIEVPDELCSLAADAIYTLINEKKK